LSAEADFKLVVLFGSHLDRRYESHLKPTSSFGEAVAQRVNMYLRNFKKLVEAT